MKLGWMRGRRHARRALVGFSCAAVAFAASDIALVRVVSATQDDTQAANYGVYGGQVSATADREQLGTSVDANFSGGALNNFYPLAYSNVAVAGTNALATWADTGPFAQAVFGGGLNGEVVAQPQYVHAQYPGTQNPQPFTGPSGANASASVTSASARAASYAASAVNPPGTAESSASEQLTLDTLLARWKARYFGAPATQPPLPVPGLPLALHASSSAASASTASSSSPDGTDGDTGYDTVYFDSVNGFVTSGHSRVHHASFGGGMIVIDNVRVDASVSNSGSGATPVTSVSIQVGGASIDGVPVTIGQNGVTVATQTVPTGQVQQATDALNQALAQSGFSVHLVTPLQTSQGASEHVDAVGVLVQWVQPAALTPPGVPSQFLDHYLGEVVIDNEAMLAAPTSSGAYAPFGGGTTFSSSIGGYTGPAASGPVSAPPASHSSRPAGIRITPAHPLWLLLLYLAWQALMIGTAASLYLWRTGIRGGIAAA